MRKKKKDKTAGRKKERECGKMGFREEEATAQTVCPSEKEKREE